MIRTTRLCAVMLLAAAVSANAQPGPFAIVPSIRALDVQFGGENLNMGATAGLQFVSHYLDLSGFYSMHSLYMDRTQSDAAGQTPTFPSTTIKDSRTLEAGAQLNLLSWETDLGFDIIDKVEQTFSENESGTVRYVTTTTHYHVEDFPSRLFIGVRGGYYEWGMPVSSASKSDNDPLVSTTGVQLGKTNLSQFMDVFTNVKTKTYYAGLAYSYFVYQNNRYQTYYVDVFFNSSTRFDPILLRTTTFDIEGLGSKGFPVRKMGYRVGLEVFVNGVSAKVEGGVRPGTYGGYVLLGAGVALPLWFW